MMRSPVSRHSRHAEILTQQERFGQMATIATALGALVAGLFQLAGYDGIALYLTVTIAASRLLTSAPIVALASTAYLRSLTHRATRETPGAGQLRPGHHDHG